MVVLESWYQKNMRHHFFSSIDPQEASWRMKTLKQRIDSQSLLGKKQEHINQLTSRSVTQAHNSLKKLDMCLLVQHSSLQKTQLDVPKRTIDSLNHIDPVWLKHHVPLLQKHFGVAFADVEHSIILGDSDQHRAGLAMAAVRDAAHLTVMQDIISKQRLLVQNALSYCVEGGAHRLSKVATMLDDAYNEELYHIATLLHQQHVYASWLS